MGWLAGLKAAKETAQIVDKFVTTKGERLEMDADQADKIRGMFAAHQRGTLFDSMVDGTSRLIRPGVTIYLLLGLDGRLIQLPDPGSIDPFWLSMFYLIMTFWFGGRALLKDLPNAVKFIMRLRSKPL